MSDEFADIPDAISEELEVGRATRERIAAEITAWARSRLSVPDSDARWVALRREIPQWTQALSFSLDARSGIRVRDTGNVGLKLERGMMWFRGGDWQTVALSVVDRESL